jgi:hypothetical protein
MAEPQPTDALLQAIDKVYRVARERIAFHENEAKKLRAALAPFGQIENAGAVDAPTHTAESYMQEVIKAAALLQEKQQ